MSLVRSALYLHKPNFLFKIVLLSLIIFFLFILFPTHILPQTSENISFKKFASSFDLQQQKRAQKIWSEIVAKNQEKFFEFDTSPGETISDSVLFSEISSSEKEKYLKQLKAKRTMLKKLNNELTELKFQSANWDKFVSKIENIPELGSVYLEAFAPQQLCKNLGSQKESQVTKLQKEITDIRVNASLSEISLGFTIQDWITIIIYLIFTTVLGGILAGKQSSIKDFFLGGRKLPWPAVCGSIIATELSAATFLIAPAIVFSKGGDMTYIQLAIGTIVARFVIGYFFIPAYYKREIYSPYDYMGNQLGPRVKNLTSILFMIGGILAQGARVYIAAKALQVVTGTDIVVSTIIIGVVSIGWTIMGGITTVIWTDTIQFLLFTIGAVLALFFVGTAIDGGIIAVISEGIKAGKFNMLNLNFNPKEAYTIWCGIFATGFLTLGSHGTDQLMAQRMFTCKNETDARKAIVWSGASVGLTFLLLMVGAGVFIYYKHFPLSSPGQVIIDNDSMKIFAIYIVQVMPPILSGLLMAALFATAISTLDSILAALSQTTISILYKPFIKKDGSDKHYVTASRIIVLIWGVFLIAFAIYCDTLSKAFADLIQFALAMAAYTYGALLGTFLLAFLPTKRDDFGLMWGVPLSMLIVFAFNWHLPIPQIIVFLACFILVVQAFRHMKEKPTKIIYVAIAAGIVMIVSFAVVGTSAEGTPVYINLAWPWHFPIGAAMTFVLGYLVGNKK
jgi:solute:Na+ symporter, SSS family